MALGEIRLTATQASGYRLERIEHAEPPKIEYVPTLKLGGLVLSALARGDEDAAALESLGFVPNGKRGLLLIFPNTSHPNLPFFNPVLSAVLDVSQTVQDKKIRGLERHPVAQVAVEGLCYLAVSEGGGVRAPIHDTGAILGFAASGSFWPNTYHEQRPGMTPPEISLKRVDVSLPIV